MSIASEITRIKNNIASAYSKISEKGGTLPETQDSENLADSIDSIQGGGGDYNIKANTIYTSSNNTIIKNIVKIDTFDVSHLTNIDGLCSGFTSLIETPDINTANIQSMVSTFYGCSSLQNVRDYNMSLVRDVSNMFSNCTSLTTANLNNWDVSSIRNTTYMFYNCSNLINLYIDNWDLARLYNANYDSMFKNCSSLSNDSLNNILKAFTTATSTTVRTLKLAGLTQAQATTCTTLSNWASAQSAGWTTGY